MFFGIKYPLRKSLYVKQFLKERGNSVARLPQNPAPGRQFTPGFYFFPRIIRIPANTIMIARAGPSKGPISATSRSAAIRSNPGKIITIASPTIANVVTNRCGVPKKYLNQLPILPSYFFSVF